MAAAKCPLCKEEIEHLDYTCEYSAWGNEDGTIDFCGDMNMNDQNESNYDTHNITYVCPKCGDELSYEDLENLDAIEMDNPLPYPNKDGYDYYKHTEDKVKEDTADNYNKRCFIYAR